MGFVSNHESSHWMLRPFTPSAIVWERSIDQIFSNESLPYLFILCQCLVYPNEEDERYFRKLYRLYYDLQSPSRSNFISASLFKWHLVFATPFGSLLILYLTFCHLYRSVHSKPSTIYVMGLQYSEGQAESSSLMSKMLINTACSRTNLWISMRVLTENNSRDP